MEKVTYYSHIDGFSLERMERSGYFDMRVQHFHNEYEIFFLIQGERNFFFNNRAYIAKSGNLILVDSNSIHMTRSIHDSEEGHDRIILYIDRNKMEQLDKKFPGLNLIRFFKDNYGIYDLTPEQQQQFLTMYERLQKEFDRQSRHFAEAIEIEIIRYFIQFMRESHVETPVYEKIISNKTNKGNTIYVIVDYISEHFEEEITLDKLAQQFFLSKYYLSRTYKEVTGLGINEHINILRTKKAKRLLEETNLTISQIAHEVGYGSVTYFEKVFKIYMTMSPLKYRKTLNIVTYTNDLSPEDPKC